MRLPAGFHLGAPMLIAAGVGVVALGATIPSIWPALKAITASGADADASDPLKPYLDQHDQLASVSQKRFEGRTPFYPPPAPKPPVPPPPPKPVDEKPPPPPPLSPAPAEYDGPKVTGMLGDIVFFDTSKVKVGEKYQTVEVLAADSPYRIKVRYTKAGHEPGEYSISAWDSTRGFDLAAANLFPKTGTGFKAVDPKADVKGEPKGGDPSKSGDGGANSKADPNSDRKGEAAHAAGARPRGAHEPSAPQAKSAADRKPAPAAGQAPAQPAEPATAGPEQPAGAAPPPQTQPANQPAKPESASANANTNGIEPIPVEQLPAEQTPEVIASMSKQVAQSALQEINAALANQNVDAHSRARLEHEAQLISARLRKDR